MLSTYPACFFKEAEGYSVIFPDLGYLATCGETLEEANAMAVDCLAGYLSVLARDGETPPPPSDAGAVRPEAVARELDSEAEDAFVTLVRVNVAEYARTHFDKVPKRTVNEWSRISGMEQRI